MSKRLVEFGPCQINEQALRWRLETAGRRLHGTIKQQPLVLFETVERAALLPVPATPWLPVTWKQAKLHSDCHVHDRGRRPE